MSGSGYRTEFMSNGEIRHSGSGAPDPYTLQIAATITQMLRKKDDENCAGTLQRGQSSQALPDPGPSPAVALFGLSVHTLDSDSQAFGTAYHVEDSQGFGNEDAVEDSQAFGNEDPVEDSQAVGNEDRIEDSQLDEGFEQRLAEIMASQASEASEETQTKSKKGKKKKVIKK